MAKYGIRFVPLADRPELAPVLARWYFDQWGHERPESTLAAAEARVLASAQRAAIPMTILALDDAGRTIGAAQLKFREMELYPDKEHWLGNVYVAADHRGLGVASRLAEQVASASRHLGVTVLHLQTEDLSGGLYARLGWKPEETVESHGRMVLVMSRELGGREHTA